MIKVIAELGVNFRTFNEAESMIKLSKDANTYAVKFQLFNEENIKDSPIKDLLKPLILSRATLTAFCDIAHKENLQVAASTMYPEAMQLAVDSGVDIIKIRFKDRENQPLIDKAVAIGKDVIISIPRPTLDLQFWNPRIYQIYCIPKYPPMPEDFNLDEACACRGFSSHFPHVLFDIAFAINRNFENVFLEKHVMMEKSEPIDKNVSITFAELKTLISDISLLERIKRTRL